MSDTASYRPKTSDIPDQPGVYRFSDSTGRILYVGKAKNLRSRLSSYFVPLENLHERTRRMVTTAAAVDWTVVRTDVEALQLEYTWIKEFEPPFNVKFRDDKSYPYIAITLADEAPRVLITRNQKIKGAKYFGPYPKMWAVRETVDLMVKAFPIRTCSDSNYKKALQTGRPCFLGQINRCGGPCSGKVTLEQHRSMVNNFISFMEGNDKRFVTEITNNMRRASHAQEYEKAARCRDQLRAVEAVLEKSTVVLSQNVDTDVFGVAHDELAAAIQQFIVRSGRIKGVKAWTLDKELDLTTAELLESVLQVAYQTQGSLPKEIIFPVLPEDSLERERWLAQHHPGSKVHLRAAQRGEKFALMQTATLNAQHALALYKNRRVNDFTTRTQALTDIQHALGMIHAPLRMECFDVSHFSGTHIVASMVVFEDGMPKKEHYRRFSVAESRDDTESLYQVITRRLAYLNNNSVEARGNEKTGRFSYPPQLLIVDGGQPQVQAASRALSESGVENIFLCGLAKRLEEIWLPNSDFPIIFPRGSEALFMLQRIRDEAHRFALAYQKSQRKRDVSSLLSEIPGLGSVRTKHLLRHFGSVAAIKKATPEQITEVNGIGSVLAETIYTRLRSNSLV